MNLDDMIRNALAEHENDLAEHPDLLAQVTAGVRHRRTTRTAIAVGIAVLVIALAIPLALTGFHGAAAPAGPKPSTSPTSAPPANDGAVAWLDSPASEPTPPAGTPSAPPRARPCTAADLPSDATMDYLILDTDQFDSMLVKVVNVGSSRCTLDGYPTIFDEVNGHKTVRPARHDTAMNAYGFPVWKPATIDPGQAAYVLVSRTFDCADPGTGRKVAADGLTWAGKDIRFPSKALNGGCAQFLVSQWFVEVPATTFPAYDWDNLTASIEESQTHITANTLHFTVTLANPTDIAIALTPCPVYGITLNGVLLGSYALNCAAAPSIPAHSVVRFAMQADISGVPTGLIKIIWSIDGTPGEPIDAFTVIGG